MKTKQLKRIILAIFLFTPFLLFAIIKKRKPGDKPQSEKTFKAVLRKSMRPIPAYGFNGENWRGPSWTNTAYRDSAALLKFKFIRYPGGTLSSYWDWRKGWFVDDNQNLVNHGIKVSDEYRKTAYSPTGLSDLKLLVDQTKCNVVFVLNMVTKDVNDQIEMLQSAQAMGINVKYVELGNEYNIPRTAGRIKYPTAEAYGAECEKWIVAIKSVFPDVKIAVVGGNLPWAPDLKNWDNILIRTAPDADAMVAHIYPSCADVDVNDGINFESTFNSFAQVYDDYGFNTIRKPIWITEFNISWSWNKGPVKPEISKFSRTWAEALSVILMLSQATNLPVSGPQMVLDHSIGNWNGYAALEQRKDGVHVLSNGIGMGTWCRICYNKSGLRQISFQTNGGKYAQDFEVLGWQFGGGHGQSNIIVNYTANPIKIDVTALMGTNDGYYDLMYADKNKMINTWRDVNHERRSIGGNEIELPPFSIATF